MKLTKLFWVAALIFLFPFMLPLNSTASALEIDDLLKEDPNLIIARDYKVPVFQAGTSVRLAIPLVNTSYGDAQRIHVSPVIDDPDHFPFVIDGLVSRQSVSSVSGMSNKDVGVSYQVRSNAEAKMYPIRFNIEYTSLLGKFFTLSETLYIKIENDKKAPTVQLHSVNIEGDELSAGKTTRVTVDLQNSGDLLAKDVKATLTGFPNNKIRLSTPQQTKTVGDIENKHFKSVFFDIVTDADLDQGTYTADLILEYKDEYDKIYSTEVKIYLPVASTTGENVELAFENLNSPKETIRPNQDFNLTFDLKNIGNEEAQNVKLSIISGSDILPKSVPIRTVGTFKAGESIPFTFTLFAQDGVETRNYPIEIKLEYEEKGRSSAAHSFSKYVGVFVEGKSDASDNIPKVILDSYSFGSDYVLAGESFPLNISFLNTNNASSVSNIRISISSDGDVFSPVGSSNSFYVEEIPANGRVQQNLTLRPKIDAIFKTHNITVDIEYQDNNGKSYNTREMIGIPVIQEVGLTLSDVTTSPEAFVGNYLPISVDFYNTGRALIRNLFISIEGNFDTTEGELYIGNMNPGSNNYYDTSIIPTQPGTLSGKVVFSFDDEISNSYTVEKEFSIEVMESMPAYGPDLMPREFEQPPQQSNIKYIIGGVVLVIAVGGYMINRRRKKKLEEVAWDE